jgi:beta-lactamase regulating signal transducer with metallopeptidase domain
MSWLLFIEANLVFAVLVALYCFLLRNSRQFALNRWILWGIVIFSFLIPQVPQPFSGKKVQPIAQSVFSAKEKVVPSLDAGNPFLTSQPQKEAEKEAGVSLSSVLLMLYLSGFLFFLFRYSLRLFRLIRFLVLSEKKKTTDGYWMVTTNKAISPFSFFHFIVIGAQDRDVESNAPILKHEKIHADQWHSLDVIFSEWVKIILWFNPLSYWYARLVRNNLEYLVDQQILRSGIPRYEYQYHLLREGTAHLPFSFTNYYNHSFLKRRILMMNKQQNLKWNLLKTSFFIASLLPLVQMFGQSQVSQGRNIAVIMTTEADVEELKKLQDELYKLDLHLVFDNLQLDTDGKIESVNYHLYRGNGRIGSTLNPAKMKAKGLIPFSVDLIEIKPQVGMGVGGLEVDELLNNWNDWTLLTAGIEPTKEGVRELKKKMAEVQAENDKSRLSLPLEQMEPRIGSTKYKPMNEQRMRYAEERIRQQVDQFGMAPTFYIDGLPRQTSLQDFRPEEIAELEMITVDKPVSKDGQYQI